MIPYRKACRVTCPYGERQNPFTGTAEFHKGIDLVGDDKTVVAPVAGTVGLAAFGPQCGNQIELVTEQGDTYVFMHLSSMAVKKGDRVAVGDVLGVEGSTGQVTGRHLHVEVWRGKRYTGALYSIADALGIPNQLGSVVEGTDSSAPPSTVTPNDIAWALGAYRIVPDSGVCLDKMQADSEYRSLATGIFRFLLDKGF